MDSHEADTPVKANTTQNSSLDQRMPETESTSPATIQEDGTNENNENEDDEVSNPQSATHLPQEVGDAAVAAAVAAAVIRKEEEDTNEPVVVLEMDAAANGEGVDQKKIKSSNKRRSGGHNKSMSSISYKTRKRGRKVRIAPINDLQPSEKTTFPPLPKNQYETTLIRRAVRKGTPSKSSNTDDSDDEYGDVSLGMKLTVVRGRVIVQKMATLADGRASPAQLTGIIQRGDILLSIGNVSLLQLPIDKLMGGLSPLSTPGKDGRYQKVLRLRFESSKSGLKALQKHEEEEEFKKMALGQTEGMLDPANEMFSLFPMADQLSGAPLLYTQPYLPEFEKKKGVTGVIKEEDGEDDDDDEEEDEEPPENDVMMSKSPNSIIASTIATETKEDTERLTSEFFEWSERVSTLMKKAVQMMDQMDDDQFAGLTQTERTELGRRVMKLAKVLSFTMEDMDKGKDLRSFKIWSSNFSLRSSASARRRYVMDTVSLRSGRANEMETPIEDDSDDDGSQDGSGSLDGVDGDELLLGLAARDDVWQKQVIQFLEESIKEMEKKIQTENDEEEKSPDDAQQADISSAITKELGSFLFGENMTKIMKKKNKRSYVIPPEEITTVLFDLTTILSTSAPDEITVLGPSVSQSFQSSLVSGGKSKTARRTNVLLANQYLLNQALPVWLESFRPLSWEQRRVLWPRDTGTPVPGGTVPSEDDDLTLDDSFDSSPSLLSKQSKTKTKDIREIIEDQELDIETRSETCFLVTYYFTQNLLEPFLNGEEKDIKTAEKEAVAFIQKYGAYLQLHTSLSSAAAAKAATPIKELLKLAKRDPTHREAMRHMKAAGSLVFYDMRKLSAVIELLNCLRFKENTKRRDLIRNMCVSAYPDLRPWQVRKACLNIDKPDTRLQMTEDESWLMDYYYEYLSMLLHPQQGNESARADRAIVKEWCEWSIGILPSGIDQKNGKVAKRRDNFFRVAARSSSDHLSYRRDLETLLKLSMKAEEHELALDLGTEILDSKKLLRRTNISEVVLTELRIVALKALNAASTENGTEESNGFKLLKRVLKLFQDMSSSEIENCRDAITVSDELYSLFEHWKVKDDLKGNDAQMLKLLDFVIGQSAPEDVLKALARWTLEYLVDDSSMHSRLEELLKRGVEVAMKSGEPSLFRLQQARQGYSEENQVLVAVNVIEDKVQPGIWSRLETGDLRLEK
ncbi:unnamed protein product [Cylindrotheca closterium]|uniref:PDZ domain-containing protein n=1 Tax=Cylindrotheca closterium TaxID=2856 RepID=A0AAD2GC58_9STRA|nr:unnamed protein product [Cylindrotheca closterium]